MALAYLLSPTFQIENTAGKPASGGHLEVYIAGSRDKYYCASDFNGTLHPFKIELDSLGSNIVLADDTQAYDVYVYNRYGGLMMSRYNVKPGSGGGVSGATITSSDGSIEVIPTATGVDLRVDSESPTTLRCSGSYSNGSFGFVEFQRDGQNAFVNNSNQVIVNEGWWHYDVTARIHWPADPAQNETVQVSLINPNTDTFDDAPLDLTYEHYETRQIGGEFKCTQDGTVFSVTMTGVPAGASVELVDFGIHSVIGEGGAGGKYNAGNGIVIDEPNRVISVDFDDVQEKLTAGTGITIDENNVISVDESAINEIFPVTYNVTTVSEIRSALMAGKLPVLFLGDAAEVAITVQRIPIHDFFDGSTYRYAQFWQPTVYTSSSTAYPPYANFAVFSVSYSTETDETTWSTSYKYIAQQPDWAEADATKLTFIKNKPANLVQDADYVHTDNNFTNADVTKLSGIESGAEVNVQANWNESDSSSDSFILNKPTIPSGSQLVPSATPSDAGEVLTVDQNGDPTWAPAQAPISAGDGIDITNNVVSAKVDGTSVTFNADGELETIAAPQVQSDWAEADPTDVSFIQNKPGQTSLVAGSNITIVDDAQNNTVTISAASVSVPVQDVTIDNVSVVNAQGIAEIPRQVNADWNSSAGASEILNKPSIPVIGTVTL